MAKQKVAVDWFKWAKMAFLAIQFGLTLVGGYTFYHLYQPLPGLYWAGTTKHVNRVEVLEKMEADYVASLQQKKP